nr:RHS repeat-associated core domain-containing protein [uncultured Moellerella sp.]
MKVKSQLLHLSSLGYLTQCSLGFNGERQDRVIGAYFLGNGYRVYNPRIKRFQAYDRLSPFEQGGINGYAYCLGDPINIRDPSGHFAILGLLIGAIIGAVVGATISAAAEGIRAVVTHTAFDWKQVGIGAALGFISGGFGAAAKGLKMGAQIGLAAVDSVVSGAADFGLNVAAGQDMKNAGINASIGAVVGFVTFGVNFKPNRQSGEMIELSTMRRSNQSSSRRSSLNSVRSEYFDARSLSNDFELGRSNLTAEKVMELKSLPFELLDPYSQFELANYQLTKYTRMSLDGPSTIIPNRSKSQVFNSIIFGFNLGETSF